LRFLAPLPATDIPDEVSSFVGAINRLLERVNRLMGEQRRFVADAAHELRSPIASIRAQLEVALDHPASQDWRQTASDVLEDTLRLARLAEDLLVLARLDEHDGRRTADQQVDLTELAAAEVSRHDGSRVPVLLSGPEPLRAREPCVVAGDADGLRRMLGNLIENAVRYARTRVTVSIARDGPNVRLTVTDDGPGIPARDAQRAFGRFTRLDNARSRDGDGQGGAGLGLAIVRATAQAHDGSAWLEDGQPGLAAVVLLPAVDRAQAQISERPPTSFPKAAGR